MKLQTQVGQIHLTHPRDKNYTSVFEEVFSKHGKKVQLFAVIEVEGGPAQIIRERKEEYDHLTKTIVSAYKRAYVGASGINESTFEKALGAVNSALSKLAGDENKVSWYEKTHAVLAAFYDNRLSISVTGKGAVYLLRDNSLNQISEEDAEEISPIKIFSNYATGGLAKSDRVLVTTNELFNHLSIQRVGEFINEERLDDACEEIIETLKDTKDAGFAAFLFEVHQEGRAPVLDDEQISPPQPEVGPRAMSLERLRSKGNLYFVLVLFGSLLKKVFDLLKYLVLFLLSFFRRRSSPLKFSSALSRPGINKKKIMLIGLIIAVVLLAGSITVAAIRKSADQKKTELNETVSRIEHSLDEAEAALIYQDGERATILLTEAEDGYNLLIQQSQGREDKYQALSERLESIKNKIQKQTIVENPTVLSEFQNIPTDLIRSPNGFLGYNRNTGTVSFYDFRTGESTQLFAGQNTNGILLIDYVGGNHGYVALNRSGAFQKVDLGNEQISDYESGGVSIAEIDDANVKSLVTFGAGDLARLYVLDAANGQIYRMSANENGITQAENWIRSENTDFGAAADIAIDGNIYVLFPDHLDKYFNGSKQNFSLFPLLPEIKNATKVYTSSELDSIYVLDPDNKRIVAFDKNGGIKTQLLSDEFRELGDLYVDESNDILYVLSGSRLLQIDLQ